MLKLIEWLLIFFITAQVCACGSLTGRLDGKYRNLGDLRGPGWDKVKEAPYCIWHHNCADAGGSFSRLAEEK